MSPPAAAWGVHQVVNENMTQAARMHLLERNWDPRRLTLVAFGGAGPTHAAALARLLGIRRIVFPLGAGATSALGCLAAPLSFQFNQSLPSVLGELDWAQINAHYAALEARGRAALAEAGVGAERVQLLREADLRIYGQIHEVTIPIPAGELGPGSLGALRDAFGQVYRRLYSRFTPTSVLEAVNWKLTARGPARPVELHHAAPPGAGLEGAFKRRRPAYFGAAGDFLDTPVYDRYLLPPGSELAGPAIVEERETTVVLPPAGRAVVDEYWNMILQLQPSQNGGASG
jgi:N-methylhydantoinase A/oxoprolinase/acetone carboxylase beta subunit